MTGATDHAPRVRGTGRPSARSATAALVLTVVAICLATAQVASAAWTSGGAGAGVSRSLRMPTGKQPTAAIVNGTVTVTWAASLLPTTPARPVAGYVVRRLDGNGAAVATGGTCASVVAGTSCSEPVPGTGRWSYTVTPVQGQWRGGTSPASAALVIGTPGFTLTAPATATAGTPFTMALQAVIAGYADPTYTGTKALSVTGASAAPNGAQPTVPASATFDATGAATLTLTLVRTGSTTITVSDGTRTATATIVVAPSSSTGTLVFVDSSTSCSSGVVTLAKNVSWATSYGFVDAYGNQVVSGTQRTVTVTVSNSSVRFTLKPSSPATLVIPANVNPAKTSSAVEFTWDKGANATASLVATSGGQTLTCAFG